LQVATNVETIVFVLLITRRLWEDQFPECTATQQNTIIYLFYCGNMLMRYCKYVYCMSDTMWREPGKMSRSAKIILQQYTLFQCYVNNAEMLRLFAYSW